MKQTFQVLSLALLCLWVAGCTAPIGADKVGTRRAYAQVEGNALRTGKPGADTVALLHRFDLDSVAARHPDEAVRQLHQKAVDTGERDLLFALAELCYVAGEHIDRSVKPWDSRDARDFYLGSAVYAYLFLFGDGREARPSAFDRRFRVACDFYNYGLGLGLAEPKSPNAAVRLESGRRRLPVGEIDLRLGSVDPGVRLDQAEQVLLADQYRVRGLSVRNREPGLGAPLIAVGRIDPELGIRRCLPGIAFLRVPGSLEALNTGTNACSLELYSAYGQTEVAIGETKVPLESDLTTFRAYTLSQSFIWSLGMMQFLAPAERVRSQLILNQPYEPGLIPVVFVHGTFSSPVTWAELANTLTGDPVVHSRYQIWSFVYSSGNPLPVSAHELRQALTATVQKLDPEGKDPALRQMVIIGHSQGGLLTKLTATETEDRIWKVFSTKPIEELDVSEEERAELRRLLFVEPLPFVRRVVFICTPHRGSYLASGFVRRLTRRLMSLPATVISRGMDILTITEGSSAGEFLRGKMPTSLDSMSPKNPGLLALADIPVSPPIKANTIVAVLGDDDPRQGRDGIVAYESAHVDYAESEFVVRGPHTCLNMPSTIEEVRRILHTHLADLPKP